MIKIASVKTLTHLADQWLESRALSPVTTRAYRLETSRFIKWISSKERVASNTLDRDLISDYFSIAGSEKEEQFSLAGISRPLQTNSMQQTKRIINLWMRWCASLGLVRPELALATEWKPPMRTNVTNGLSRDKLKRLLASPEKSKAPQSVSELRTQFLVSLAFWLGAKPSETSTLKSKEIRVTDNGIEVLLPKQTAKPIWVPGPLPLLQAWESYSRRRGESKFAIASMRDLGEGVSASSIGRIISRNSSQMNNSSEPIEKVNSRQLKAAFVSQANASGWPFNELRYYMRRNQLIISRIDEIKTCNLQALTYKTAQSLEI